ncbi:MAG: winged helix-turn-helix domain-containing protein [Prevotellaceae bacterium]|nr:winged helix-turn-helix domain-containing protein [Prevotellaceae bacterium]
MAEAISRIKELTGIERKPTQVRTFLHKHGFKYRKLSSTPGKADTEKQKQFLNETLTPAIEKTQKGEIKLLFCDAVHFTLSAFLCMGFGRRCEHF